MSDPGSMSALTIVAISVVTIILAAFVNSSLSLFEIGNNQIRENWVSENLGPEVRAACESDKDGHYPEIETDDSYLSNNFDSDTIELEEIDYTEDQDLDSIYRLVFKSDDSVDLSAKIANSSSCHDLFLDGSLDSSDAKFRVDTEEDDNEATIEVE